LVKGEGIVFAKKDKSFDPAQIPKAIQDAGFTATEVIVVAAGTVERSDGTLQLSIPGLSHPFVLLGGPKFDAVAKRENAPDLNFRITGKLGNGKQGPALTVEDFQEVPKRQVSRGKSRLLESLTQVAACGAWR
jgi:hypothetical protein